MQLVTYKGANAYLLDDWPNWSQPVELTAELPRHLEAGITQRETRRPQSDRLRLALRYQSHVSGQALWNLRDALQALSTEPVLCPLWIASLTEGDTPAISAEYWVVFTTSSVSIVHFSAAPFSGQSFPLMVGRLTQVPDVEPIGGTDALVSFSFSENSTEALVFPAYTPPSGPTTQGTARPVWPFRPDWKTDPTGGLAGRAIDRSTIGQGRVSADAYFTQPSITALEHHFTLSGAEALQLVTMLANLGANTVWVPSHLLEARLTTAALSTDDHIHVDNANAREDNDWCLLDDLDTRTARQITGVGGGGTLWQFATTLGHAYGISSTAVYNLLLCRPADSTFRLSYDSAEIAHTSLRFTELPWERDTASGETLGDTLGAVSLTTYLYRFFQITQDGFLEWLYTSFERNLSMGGKIYALAPIEHGDIRETLGIERSSVSLRTRYSAGHPLGLFIPFRLEWPLQLQIFEARVTAGDVFMATGVFNGEVARVRADGPYLTADCRNLAPIFERKIPRMLLQRSCNWSLFETRCGLSKNAWRVTAMVDTYTAATCALVLAGVTWGGVGDAPTLAAHWFAGGWLKLGTHPAAQLRSIADNAAEAAGALTLTLANPLGTAPSAGDPVELYPGCDGAYETCIDKFANGPAFGGFPHMPIGTTLVAPMEDTSSGGKK